MLVLGKEMTLCRQFLTPLPKLIFRFLVVWLIAGAAILILWRMLERIGERETGRKKPLHASVVYLIIFAGFVPMWLINWPGTFTGDLSLQVKEFELGLLSQSFPLLHTVFVGFFVTLGKSIFGSYNAGIALAVFVQLLILSGILTYIVIFFDRRSAFPHAGRLLVLLFVLNPVCQLYSKDLVRDTLFSAFAMLTGFLIYSAAYETERIFSSWRGCLIFAAVMLMTLFLRNTAILLITIEFLLLAVKFLKEKRPESRKCLALLIAVLAVWGVWKGFAADRATLKNSVFDGVGGGEKEVLSVPIQQAVRAAYFNWNSLPQEDKNILLEMFSEATIKDYDDDNADVVKAAFDQNKFKEDWQKYSIEWLKLGMMYKRSYLEAFLVLNTEGYYPDTVLDGNGIYGKNTYYTSGTTGQGHPASLFPKAYNRLSKTFSSGKLLEPLPFKLFFSPAVMLYILLFAVFYALYVNRKGAIILLPALVIHIGDFFAPVVSLRYYLTSFIAAAPAIILVLSLSKGNLEVRSCSATKNLNVSNAI